MKANGKDDEDLFKELAEAENEKLNDEDQKEETKEEPKDEEDAVDKIDSS